MNIEQMEMQFKALADQNRLKLLSCLKQGEVCVCEFVDKLGISQPAVSQHLKKLKEAGIIKERKSGKWRYYSLAYNQSAIVQHVIDELAGMTVCACKLGDVSCS